MHKRILITGGTGFLGSHLADRLQHHYDIVIGGSPDEQNDDDRVAAFDLADAASVDKAIQRVKPDVIIHAGAMKSLVEAEENPVRCIDVNINGSKHVALSAIEHGVSFVLGISSNKVTLPTGLYSHSKAVMERMFARLSGTDTQFASVRLGNLLWAPGSFLTKWQEMMEQEGVVRSSGVGARRFLQTVDHACELVAAMTGSPETIAGSIVTPDLKAASIEDVLDLWVEANRCDYDVMESRSVDHPKDVLIGEAEFQHTQRMMLNDLPCFQTTPGQKPEQPLHEPVHSENAGLYQKDELQELVTL